MINSKRFWKYLKSRKCDSVGISTLKNKIGRSITEGGCKATILNQQFSSVFTEDDSQPMPDINYHHQDMPGFDITIRVSKN